MTVVLGVMVAIQEHAAEIAFFSNELISSIRDTSGIGIHTAKWIEGSGPGSQAPAFISAALLYKNVGCGGGSGRSISIREFQVEINVVVNSTDVLEVSGNL